MFYKRFFMSYKKFIAILSIFFFIILTKAVSVQGQVSSQSLQNVNVNELSDAQILQLLQQGGAAGLSDSEILVQAQARGMSADQVQALQRRMADVRKRDLSGNKVSDSTQQQGSRQLNYGSDTSIRRDVHSDIYDALRPKIFGADLFRNKNISFEPNLKLATPRNYIVGPGDQLVVSVYGKSVANWKLEVSPDGNVNIPGIGLINLSGRTIEQSTAIIKGKLLANNYAIGQGTSVGVSLGNIRSIQVTMLGQVVRPGTYTLPSLATVFNALYSSGGPNDNGSFREIAVIRDNRVIKRLDVYDFLTKGDGKDNIVLQDQDIIQVPTYRTRVALSGEIKIPGLFEVLPGETLWEVLKFAGGFTDQAYTSRIKVVQVSGQQQRITDVVESDYKGYTPLRGDKYIIERILNRYENRVMLRGAVFRPGAYELQPGLTLSGLVTHASGLTEDAYEGGRGNITRLKSDNTKELIPFNLKDILNKTAPDLALEREDSVVVTSLFDLRNKYMVAVQGEVRKPGKYAYAAHMKVGDLVIAAGGFAEGASAKRIEVARRVSNSDPSTKDSKVAEVYSVNVDEQLKPGEGDFELEPYDIVSVYGLPGYEKQRSVKVDGEVLYPGYYTIQKKNEKISDIIARAGGLIAGADVDGGTLKRSNIAILGVEKNKADTAELERERIARLDRLKKNYKDSTKTQDSTEVRNNYVGIDLREILEKPGSSIDLLVEDGDEIRVPKQQQVVRVNGEVLYPSAVVYSKSKTFKTYVLNAGGFSPKALKRGAYVVYPNGTVKGTSKVLFFFNSHPNVKPGSEIYVPRKPEPKGDTGQQIIGYSTALASLAAIILTIIRL